MSPCAIQLKLPLTDFALDSVEKHTFDHWVGLAEGEELRACEVTPEQQSTVHRLTLAFRGFAYEQYGLNSDLFKHFARGLIDLYLSLDEHEPADDLLETFFQQLDDILPQVSY